MFHHLFDKADHASVGGALLLAGILPAFFNSNVLSAIYFALLIPPAAYHCWMWWRKTVWPEILKMFK